MSEKMTNADLKAKIEWEGGVVKAWEYGINADDILDPELSRRWRDMQMALDDAFDYVHDVRDYLDNLE